MRVTNGLGRLQVNLKAYRENVPTAARKASIDAAIAVENFFKKVWEGSAGLADNKSSWQDRKAAKGQATTPLRATGAYLKAIKRYGSVVRLRNGAHRGGIPLRALARILERDRPHWALARAIAVAAYMHSLDRGLRRVRL